METFRKSRRTFIRNAGITGAALPLLGPVQAINEFTNAISMEKKKDKLGVALVGLGGYATGQLAPALQQTTHCYLAGIVTGSPEKIPVWQGKYGIPDKNVYNYGNFDSIRDNPDIDIIYVVLPNSLHAEYTIRAFAAGKHVICEKPMAITVEDCDRMLAASKKAGKQLSIGYRLHFEPFNLEMARLGSKQVYGKLSSMEGAFGFKAQAGQWRLDKKMAGGGPLMDLGIYVVQGLCYTSGMEPISVTALEGAKTDPARFPDVEQSLSWTFSFPGKLEGKGTASYDDSFNFLRATAEKGMIELKPAYNYGGQRGTTPEGPMTFPNVNQQARQMDAFAQSVKSNTPTIVPGELGKRDVKYLQAIYEAMASGKTVKIPG
ncbi:MAG: Gfo/Idh/MocA family oxidoreductase [Chitinophagaceae bacterium]|nr:MAG: Gfo/Idh/MocA family oxidoreductase [Chitinophagaceae bacterium]